MFKDFHENCQKWNTTIIINSFFISVFNKKRLWHKCFLVNFKKLLRILFHTKYLRRLLLTVNNFRIWNIKNWRKLIRFSVKNINCNGILLPLQIGEYCSGKKELNNLLFFMKSAMYLLLWQLEEYKYTNLYTLSSARMIVLV